MIALNCPREGLSYVQDSDPILGIPHDDMPDPFGPFAGKNVILWRCMSPRSQLYRALPHGAHVVGANEDEQDWPTWYAGWVQEVRANRPDLVIHHPPANTQGQFPVDPALLAMCDVLDVHVATFWTADQMRAWVAPMLAGSGKPWWATEVEADPLDPGQMALLLDGAHMALDAGAKVACLWGARQDFPDVLFHPEILAAVRQFNAGETNVATDPQIAQVLAQNDLIADALYDLTQLMAIAEIAGALGPGSHAALLQDAKTKVNALNPGKYVFP